MTAREAAQRLVHDVAKYVARTARNLPRDGAIDRELAAMLARDLYELGAGRRRASLVLEELAAPIDPLPAARAPLAAARALLAEADALEPRVRSADADAVARAAALALDVERTLRALARELA